MNDNDIGLHDWYCSLRWGINASICPACGGFNMACDIAGNMIQCSSCPKKYTLFYDTAINTPYRSLYQLDSLLEVLSLDNSIVYRKETKQLDWNLLLYIIETVTHQPPVIHSMLKKAKGQRSFYIKYLKSLGVPKHELFYALLHNPLETFSEPEEVREYDASVISEWSSNKDELQTSIDYLSEMDLETDELLTDTDTAIVVKAIHEGIAALRSSIQDVELFELHKTRKQLAEAVLVERNRGLLVKIAYEIYSQNKYTTLDDCIQECSLALLDIVQYFNPTLGYKLSTYVIYPIKHRVTMSLGKQDRPIYLPAKKRKEISEYMILEKELMDKTGTKPTENDMAKAMLKGNYTESDFKKQKAKIMEIKQALLLNPLSLDAFGDADDEQSMYDMAVYSQNDSGIEEEIHDIVFKDNIISIIDKTLPWVHSWVVKLYYGLGNNDKININDIVNTLNDSRMALYVNSDQKYNAADISQMLSVSKNLLADSELKDYI